MAEPAGTVFNCFVRRRGPYYVKSSQRCYTNVLFMYRTVCPTIYSICSGIHQLYSSSDCNTSCDMLDVSDTHMKNAHKSVVCFSLQTKVTNGLHIISTN